MPDLLTIGYQGCTIAEVLAELRRARVSLLIDVRAVAQSRKPGFSKRQLAAGLDEQGIAYVHLQGLGTPKPGRDAVRAGHPERMEPIFREHMTSDRAQAELAQAKGAGAGETCVPAVLRAGSDDVSSPLRCRDDLGGNRPADRASSRASRAASHFRKTPPPLAGGGGRRSTWAVSPRQATAPTACRLRPMSASRCAIEPATSSRGRVVVAGGSAMVARRLVLRPSSASGIRRELQTRIQAPASLPPRSRPRRAAAPSAACVRRCRGTPPPWPDAAVRFGGRRGKPR